MDRTPRTPTTHFAEAAVAVHLGLGDGDSDEQAEAASGEAEAKPAEALTMAKAKASGVSTESGSVEVEVDVTYPNAPAPLVCIQCGGPRGQFTSIHVHLDDGSGGYVCSPACAEAHPGKTPQELLAELYPDGLPDGA